ncbi:serine/threonine protein kinase [Nonomuraea sp. bgisy101]|uniref:serine/threonine protein kinase n=1 Tax=Nonomuraea sp. bgisy101 TaxID=3413784 RepID=UPI003D733EBC
MDALSPGDPERFGDHAIVGRLGVGPRGAVYLGRDSDDGELRAIKPLTDESADDSETLDRLRSVKRVSSSYVARVFDVGVEDGTPYVVREHVEGRSLAETVEADGPLTDDALERVAVGVLTALTSAHLAGVTHRGLTPHNVILGADGPRVTGRRWARSRARPRWRCRGPRRRGPSRPTSCRSSSRPRPGPSIQPPVSGHQHRPSPAAGVPPASSSIHMSLTCASGRCCAMSFGLPSFSPIRALSHPLGVLSPGSALDSPGSFANVKVAKILMRKPARGS